MLLQVRTLSKVIAYMLQQRKLLTCDLRLQVNRNMTYPSSGLPFLYDSNLSSMTIRIFQLQNEVTRAIAQRGIAAIKSTKNNTFSLTNAQRLHHRLLDPTPNTSQNCKPGKLLAMAPQANGGVRQLSQNPCRHALPLHEMHGRLQVVHISLVTGLECANIA